MKTISILFLFLLSFFITKTEAQPWEPLNSGTPGNLFDVCFSNQSIGYVTVNDGTYLKTENSGANWIPQSTGFATLMNTIYFIDNSAGFGAGIFGRIYKTTNAGTTWVMSNPVGFNLKSVNFADGMVGYIVGDHSTILKTTNSGNTWVAQTSPFSDASLTDVIEVNGKWYVTVASSETNLMYTLDGSSWIDGRIRDGYILSCAISFLGETGYIGGFEQEQQVGHYRPQIFLTSNNGNSWREYKSLSNGQIYGIVVSPNDVNKACAVGQYINDPVYGNAGLIMRTSDGGLSWSEEQWGNSMLRSVTATSTSFYIVGNGGLILKSDHNVGISSNNLTVPASYELSQNYPNPFNPETNINFSLPEKTNVKLVIYGITGKEIETLINEILLPGNYEFSFKSKDLTSGIYLYTLTSKDFVATKKMILIK